ncbi:MAG: hypothetical protein IPG56_08660 [Caulobacteraceae bacterium]|nr:hypothetical protein [Caulobacteraceae bacterium]
MGTKLDARTGTGANWADPLSRGIVFICMNCSRPTATGRDAMLRVWGERGIIAEVARKLKCRAERAY